MTIINANVTVEQSPYGILSPATDSALLEGDDWVRSVDYWTTSCAVQHTITNSCETGQDGPYDSQGQTPSGNSAFMQDYTPFEIISEIKCSTMGSTPEEIRSIAEAQAQQALQFNIEREFWNGVVAQIEGNRYLTEATPFLNNLGADPDAVLGLLEQSLSGVSNPTIHMPRAVAAVSRIKPDKSGVMRTRSGARVIIGDGYNTPVTGAESDGIFAMVGTGQVTVRYGQSQLLKADVGQFDRNTVIATVITPAAVIWDDCRHNIIQVDITK